jgi:hypothetical protein
MKAPVSERLLTILGLIIAIGVALVGLFVFVGRYEYAEAGHDYLVMGYVAACFLLFFGVRLWNIPLFVLAVLACIGIQVYSSMKFDWREQYITQAQAGQPFPLEEYIDHYPSFEEHTFKILKSPDWVGFNNDCVQPALHNQPMAGQCGSFATIQQYYNIDIQTVMSQHYARMKNTAKMIQAGKMNKRTALVNCIANKGCASIPLLPKGVDANRIDPTSRDYIDVRQAFWSLINDKKMSADVCAADLLCKALTTMKAVDPAKLPF